MTFKKGNQIGKLNKNRKAFISTSKILIIIISIAFFVFSWMLVDGIAKWITNTFHLTIPQSIFYGVLGLVGLFIITKFKLDKFVIG